MKMKLTLKDVRFCTRGAEDCILVYKKDGKLYARIKWEIHKDWYAMQNLMRYYNIYELPETAISRTLASDVFLIESVKENP